MRLLAVAGELSGDGHGGPLLEGLRHHVPGLQVYGIGGPRMRAAGLQPLHAFESLQTHGLLEVVRHLPRLYRVLWSLEDWLERERPNAVLLIDYPGFNLKLARAARRLGIPVLFYSSPQIWAWRGGRLRTIAEVVDWMFVLFPFEVPLYEQAGVRVLFLGHPLVGQRATPAEVEALRSGLADGEEEAALPLVAVMPGSRPSELQRHLGTLLAAVGQIRGAGYRARWLLPVAASLDAAAVRARVAASGQPVRVVEDAFLPTLQLADLAIVCSGTATLQVGMAGIPFLVVYRVAPLSWWLLKTFAYVPYISIVNLLAGAAVAPELLQERFTAEAIRKAFLPLARDPAAQARTRKRLLAATGRLGEPGAYDRAAAALAEILRGGTPQGLPAGDPLPLREDPRMTAASIKVERVGQGPPLVFLHDWGFNAQAWQRQVEYFQGHYRLHLVDYNAPQLPPDLDHEGLLPWLRDGLQAALPEPPQVVVAHGLGAFLAFELIERGLVPQKLVLVSGLVRLTNGEGYLSGLQPGTVAALRRELAEDPRAMLQHWQAQVFSAPGEAVPAEIQDLRPLHADGFLRLAFDALISHDYRDVVPHLGCPTLILQGEADAIVPPWQATLLRGLMPGSTVELCKGCGHAPFLTQYASSNRRIERFLKAPLPSPAADPGAAREPGSG